MRTPLRLAFGISVVAAVGCSLVTSWDALPLGPLESDAGASVPPDEGGASVDAALVPSDPSDVSVDIPDATADGPDCPKGKYRCGSRLGKVPADLYSCGDLGPDLKWSCARGCVVRAGDASDLCSCFVGGSYCGGDQIVGNPLSLYECNADFTGKFIKTCTTCTVKDGSDDVCL